ncbi:MAG: hypothetical protein WCF85_15775 [Rhodospirillaceae bacterium]
MSDEIPDLSVILVVFNMRREAERTLFALSSAFQRGIAAENYEVLTVENGSTAPLDPTVVAAHGANFSYHIVEKPTPSPVPAVNLGLARARGRLVCVMIDGARIPSPGLLAASVLACRLGPRTIVTCPSLDLGPDMQLRTSRLGYEQAAEDRLLESVPWRANGYRLYTVASLNSSCDFGIFARIAETNALTMPRTLWDEIGGYDEAFDIPAGGLANHDALIRAVRRPETTLVRLLGEATFHQIHDGSRSARPVEEALRSFAEWREHYRRVRGEPFEKPPFTPLFFGELRPEVLPLIAQSAALTIERNRVRAMLETAGTPGLAAMAGPFTDFPPLAGCGKTPKY